MASHKILNSLTDPRKNLLGRTKAINAFEFSLPCVVVEQRSGLSLITLDPLGKDLRIIILPLPQEHPADKLVAWHSEFDDTIERHRLPLQKLIQCRSLPKRSWKAVKQAASAAVRSHQSLTDHPNDQLIGNKLAALHVTRGLLPLTSPPRDGLSQHFTCGEMRDVQVLQEPLALCAFAGSRWPDKDNPHE